MRGPPLATATRLAARADASCPAGKGYISTADLDRVLRRFGQSSGSEQLLQGVTEGDREGQRITYGSFVRMMTHTVKQAGRPNTLPPSRRHSPTSAKPPPPPPPCYAVSTTLLRRLHPKALDSGDYIYKPGDPVRYFYALLAGEVEVVQPREDGGEDVLTRLGAGDLPISPPISPYLPTSPHVLTRLGAGGRSCPPSPLPLSCSLSRTPTGEYFGENSLLEGRPTRSAAIRCRTPVEVLEAAHAQAERVALRLLTLHVIAAGAQALQGGLRGRLWRAACRGRARSEAPEVDRFHPDGEQVREGSPPLPPL